MTSFIFVQTLFGICFFVRYLEKIKQRQLLETGALTKIGTFYVFYLVSLCFLRPSTYISLFLLLHFPLFLLLFFEFGLKRYRIFCVRKQICGFLSLVLLKMHVGYSFRDSLRYANGENDRFTQLKWQKLIDSVVFSQQEVVHEHKFLNVLAWELKDIDKQDHLSFKNVKNLRRKYEIEDEFRHRSGQALYQTRTQSLIIGGLYIVSVYFIVNRYGFISVLDTLVISLGLFFFGLIGTLFLGRKIRWRH